MTLGMIDWSGSVVFVASALFYRDEDLRFLFREEESFSTDTERLSSTDTYEFLRYIFFLRSCIMTAELNS